MAPAQCATWILATFTFATLCGITPFALGAQKAMGASGDFNPVSNATTQSLTITVNGAVPTVRVSPLMVGSAVEYLNHQVVDPCLRSREPPLILLQACSRVQIWQCHAFFAT
jgi:hypothetical protein